MRVSFDNANISREIEVLNQPAEEFAWSAPDGLLLDLVIPPTVYPPGEDSGILCQSLTRLGPGEGRRLLEIGCGSGALSLWSAMKGFKVHSCDINPLAVAALRGRARELGLAHRLTVSEGGPGEGETLAWSGGRRYDVIIWNPPYLDPPRDGEPVLGPLEEAGMVDLDWKQGSGVVLLDEIAASDLLTDSGIVLIIRSSTTIGRHLDSEGIARGWANRECVSITFDDGENLEVLAFWRPHLGRNTEYLGETESTNSLLLDQGGAIGRCLRAGLQTSGRGQRQRRWSSSTADFAASWIVPKMSPGILQLSAGLAVMQTLDSIELHGNLEIEHWMKWPNDIWRGTGKLAGILAEGRNDAGDERFVLGIGINLAAADIESPHAYLEHSPEDLCLRLDAALSGLLESRHGVPLMSDERIVGMAWEMMSRRLRSGAVVKSPDWQGRPVGIDREGRLLIEVDEKVVTCDNSHDLKWTFNKR